MKGDKTFLIILLGLLFALIGVVSVSAYTPSYNTFYWSDYRNLNYNNYYNDNYYYSRPSYGSNYIRPITYYGPYYNFGWYRPSYYYYRYYPMYYNYYYYPRYYSYQRYYSNPRTSCSGWWPCWW